MENENISDVFYLFKVNGKEYNPHCSSEIQAELEASIKMVKEGVDSCIMYECKPLDISRYVHASDVMDRIAMYMDADKNNKAELIFSDLKDKDYEELSKRLTNTITGYFMEVHNKHFYEVLRSWVIKKHKRDKVGR